MCAFWGRESVKLSAVFISREQAAGGRHENYSALDFKGFFILLSGFLFSRNGSWESACGSVCVWQKDRRDESKEKCKYATMSGLQHRTTAAKRSPDWTIQMTWLLGPFLTLRCRCCWLKGEASLREEECHSAKSFMQINFSAFFSFLRRIRFFFAGGLLVLLLTMYDLRTKGRGRLFRVSGRNLITFE